MAIAIKCNPGALDSWQIGTLIDLIGTPRLPAELARALHARFAADHVHLLKVGRYDRDFIVSGSHDGSDAASKLTEAFFDRKLQRFERDLITGSSLGKLDLSVSNDHTQSFAQPEFRAFGREMGIGSRFLIRRTDIEGAVAIVMLWALDHGDVSHLASEITAAAEILAPIAGKHLAICDDRQHLHERLGSIAKIEADLRFPLGENRRREAQVGARVIAGWSAAAIAGDLLISKETVVTHRKRLYDHLSLDSGRDLLLWYLANHTSSLH